MASKSVEAVPFLRREIGLRDRVGLPVYDMPNPTIAAWTVIALQEERPQGNHRRSSWSVST
jgi:hypothetical protein